MMQVVLSRIDWFISTSSPRARVAGSDTRSPPGLDWNPKETCWRWRPSSSLVPGMTLNPQLQRYESGGTGSANRVTTTGYHGCDVAVAGASNGGRCISHRIDTGCALYGGTSSFVLDPPHAIPSGLHHRVEGGTVTLGVRANRVYAVGVNYLGGFRAGDRQVLEASLRKSLKAVDWPDDLPTWTTHVQVRSYVAAYNNSSGALLASVAWCLMSKFGQVVYEEQFYVSTTEGLTLGTAKDIVNKAIARRIQKAAVVLASGESPPRPLPIAGDYLYGSIDDAARDLPPSMFSSRIGEMGNNAIDWTSFDPKEPIDWANVVATQ